MLVFRKMVLLPEVLSTLPSIKHVRKCKWPFCCVLLTFRMKLPTTRWRSCYWNTYSFFFWWEGRGTQQNFLHCPAKYHVNFRMFLLYWTEQVLPPPPHLSHSEVRWTFNYCIEKTRTSLKEVYCMCSKCKYDFMSILIPIRPT